MLVRSAAELKSTTSEFSVLRRPLALGISIGHPSSAGAGSLGGFASSLANPSVVGVLSTATAFCPEAARVGDFIHQPGPLDNPMFVGETRVARLDEAFPPNAGPRKHLDCAFAVLHRNVEVEGNVVPDFVGAGLAGRRLTFDPQAKLLRGERVAKLGRTTGLTFGTVTAVDIDNLSVAIGRSSRLGAEERRVFHDLIEIEGVGDPFSGPGDTGATVFSLDWDLVVGMVFASMRAEDHSRSYAQPMKTVLDALGVAWL